MNNIDLFPYSERGYFFRALNSTVNLYDIWYNTPRGDVLQCIYVDVLIILNWYINYFILLATAKITHTAFKYKRLILSALLGAFSSLLIILPTMNYITNVIIKFILSVVLILIAFGKRSIADTLKMSLYFCVIGFIFAGMIMALKNTLNSNIISTNNSYIYVNFSIVFLIVSTTICYITLCIIRHLLDKNTGSLGDWSLKISYRDKSITIKGLADTGNALTDTFSGKPVIVCSKEILKDLISIPNLEDINNLKGFRLIPFSTIDKGGLIVSFKPDSIVIVDNLKGISKNVDALIGVSGNSKKAIFNPKILI